MTWPDEFLVAFVRRGATTLSRRSCTLRCPVGDRRYTAIAA